MPPFDKDTFADYLDDHQLPPFGIGRCARFVRLALEAAGCDTNGHPDAAKDWGPTLIRIGFVEIAPDKYVAEKGDIAVFDQSPATPNYGHIGGYDGTQWVSDFAQQDMWPSRRARVEKTSFKIYRFASSPVSKSGERR